MKTLSLFFKATLLILISTLFATSHSMKGQVKTEPLQIGIIGLTHSHVHGILGRPDKGDIKIVGIVEPDRGLAKRYAQQYGYSMDMVYNTMAELLVAIKPEAVTAFGSTYEHLKVVETFAPLGIHVMVEKPLAVNMQHANKMSALAKKHHIHLLTNYETTWYATNHRVYEMVQDGEIGDLRRVVVNDGHEGPAEIGVNSEFLDWLTDPVENGGGALMDFGCYGANLITWLTKGEEPVSVMAMTQTNKPEMYPKVDDEATIVLQYPTMQCVIQASWNWPFSRKDMEVYGQTGYVISENSNDMRFRLNTKNNELKEKLEDRPAPFNDPFAFLAAVVRGKITVSPHDLSSLENNITVTKILDAARESVRTGKIIKTEESF